MTNPEDPASETFKPTKKEHYTKMLTILMAKQLVTSPINMKHASLYKENFNKHARKSFNPLPGGCAAMLSSSHTNQFSFPPDNVKYFSQRRQTKIFYLIEKVKKHPQLTYQQISLIINCHHIIVYVLLKIFAFLWVMGSQFLNKFVLLIF